jgi:hypothetical protein
MKKLITLSIILLTCLSAQAKIYRLNNNPGTAAQFTNAQTAIDSCHTGDTLYAEGTTISYGAVTISNKINIIGPGYFLAQNPNTQVNPSSALFGEVTCAAGSNGSYLTGLQIGYLLIATGVNNIVIKRNYITTGTTAAPSLYLQGNNANILIVQNYITGIQPSCWAPLYLAPGCSNITIANNYVAGTGAGCNVIDVEPGASSVITNNVIWGTQNSYITINNTTFNDNIWNTTSGGGTFSNSANNSQNNNFSNCGQLDTTGGNARHNHINIPTANIFFLTGSYDAQFKLKAGSPAIGAGITGEDCGIFGGSDPYVLSGMPTVPAIYFFAAPTSGSGTLPVQVKIMSHK